MSVAMYVSLPVSYTDMHTHTPVKPLPCLSPPFFSLHQLSDTQQWAVTLEENRAREGERGGGIAEKEV